MREQREAAIVNAWSKNARDINKDAFSKMTRRWVFWPIVWTFCGILGWFAYDPTIEIITIGGQEPGFFPRLFKGSSETLITLTGGHVILVALDSLFMIVGFYALPSKRR